MAAARPLAMLSLAVLLALAAVAALAIAQGLSIGWQAPARLTVAPNETASADFNLTWGGGSPLRVTVSLLSEPVGWTHIIGAWAGSVPVSSESALELDVGPGATYRMWVSVTPHVMAAAQCNTLVLRAQGGSAPQERAEQSFVVRVSYVPRVTLEVIEPEGAEATVAPNGTAPVRLLLRNDGNGDDRFLLSAWVTSEGPPWPVVRTGGTDASGWTPLVPRGGEHEVAFEVLAPASAIADDAAEFVALVTSESAPDYTPPPAAVRLFAEFRPALSATLREPRVQTARFTQGGHGTVDLTFDVRNRGNGADGVAAGADFGDDGPAWAYASASPPVLELPVGATGTVVVTVHVLAEAPEGTYGVNVTLSSTRGNLVLAEAATVLVEGRQGVEASCAAPSAEARPGDSLDFALAVRNTGNFLDSFAITASGLADGWVLYVLPPEATLLANETAAVVVRVLVPSAVGAQMPEQLAITVRAERTKGGAKASCELTVSIEQYVAFEWHTTAGPITSEGQPVAPADALRPAPELNPHAERRRWTAPHLWLLGTGTAEASVALEAEGVPPGLVVLVDPPTAAVAWGANRTVTVTIDALPGATPGRYTVNITARSAGWGAPFNRTVPVVVTIFELDVAVLPLNITGALVAPAGEGAFAAPEGAEVRVLVTVANLGRQALPRVVVRLDRIGPAGVSVPVDSWELDLGPNATRTVAALWFAKGAGAHRLEASVVLADQSDASNDLAKASVTVTREGGGGDAGTAYFMAWAAVVVVFVLAVVYLFNRPRARMRGG